MSDANRASWAYIELLAGVVAFVAVLALAGCSTEQSTSGRSPEARRLFFLVSPDGARAVAIYLDAQAREENAWVLDLARSSARPILGAHLLVEGDWSGDGGRFAMVYRDKWHRGANVAILDPDSTQWVPIAQPQGFLTADGPSWSPSDVELLYQGLSQLGSFQYSAVYAYETGSECVDVRALGQVIRSFGRAWAWGGFVYEAMHWYPYSETPGAPATRRSVYLWRAPGPGIRDRELPLRNREVERMRSNRAGSVLAILCWRTSESGAGTERCLAPMRDLYIVSSPTGDVTCLYSGEIVGFAWSEKGDRIAMVVQEPARPQSGSGSSGSAGANSAAPSSPSAQTSSLRVVEASSGRTIVVNDLAGGGALVDPQWAGEDRFIFCRRVLHGHRTELWRYDCATGASTVVYPWAGASQDSSTRGAR